MTGETMYLLQMTSRTGALPISTRSHAGDTRSVVPKQSTRSACLACSSAVDRVRFSRLSPKLMIVLDKYPSQPYNTHDSCWIRYKHAPQQGSHSLACKKFQDPRNVFPGLCRSPAMLMLQTNSSYLLCIYHTVWQLQYITIHRKCSSQVAKKLFD